MDRTRVKHLAVQSHSIGTSQSLIIEKHASAIVGHASNILNIASKTQFAVDALAVKAAIQAETHSRQADALNQNLTSIQSNMLHLTRKTEKASAIVRRQATLVTRHAKMLFRLMQDVKALFNL